LSQTPSAPSDTNQPAKVVLVTRPQHQSAEFIQLLEQQGSCAIAFPCLEIQPLDINEKLAGIFSSLNDVDLLIFISVNAVEHFKRLTALQSIKPETITAAIATIGKATRSAAQGAGFKVSLSPAEGFNSEALLKLPELQQSQISAKSCLIVRGEGGLEQLADTLQHRGARVKYAEVYRRIKPRHDYNVTRQQLSQHWHETDINVITVTSNESLQNLYDMLEAPGRHAMLNTQLIVASQRNYQLAQLLGFQSVKVASSASNQHMLEALNNG